MYIFATEIELATEIICTQCDRHGDRFEKDGVGFRHQVEGVVDLPPSNSLLDPY